MPRTRCAPSYVGTPAMLLLRYPRSDGPRRRTAHLVHGAGSRSGHILPATCNRSYAETPEVVRGVTCVARPSQRELIRCSRLRGAAAARIDAFSVFRYRRTVL